MNDFIRAGECLYTIVMPANATAECKFAVEELRSILKKACINEPPVITDEEELPARCIHVGNTKTVAAQVDLTPSMEEVGLDGYAVCVRGDQLFIVSPGREGVIYGVYEFLLDALKVEYFAPDEWVVPKADRVLLPSADIYARPDIQTRVRNLDWAKFDEATQRRYGYNAKNGREWTTWAHTHFELIPKEKYWHTHREYYDPTGNQLCLTAPGLVETMTEEVISRLTPERFARSEVQFVMVGHEDNGTFCNCPRCQKEIEKYGKSGVMMRFINPVADAVTAFVAEKFPGCKATVITFGYGPTIEAPVRWKEDGDCEPIDESVVAHENVGVMLAPLGSDWAHSLVDDRYNKQTRRSLVGWRAIKPELFVWTYDSVFDDSFIFIDNWKYLSESYNLFKEYGATYLFDQGHTSGTGFNFEALRNYVRGKLMWDLDVNVDQLVCRFMKGYYKEAGEAVKTYFFNLRAHFEQVEKQFEKKGIPYKQTSYVRTQPYYREPEFWDKSFLKENIEALKACWEALPDEGRLGAKNRLAVEMLSPIYVYLEVHGFDLDKDELKWYIDFFKETSEQNNMYYRAEHGPTYTFTIEKKLIEWRSLLFAKEAENE